MKKNILKKIRDFFAIGIFSSIIYFFYGSSCPSCTITLGSAGAFGIFSSSMYMIIDKFKRKPKQIEKSKKSDAEN